MIGTAPSAQTVRGFQAAPVHHLQKFTSQPEPPRPRRRFNFWVLDPNPHSQDQGRRCLRRSSQKLFIRIESSRRSSKDTDFLPRRSFVETLGPRAVAVPLEMRSPVQASPSGDASTQLSLLSPYRGYFLSTILPKDPGLQVLNC
jgi:hypothetical protein